MHAPDKLGTIIVLRKWKPFSINKSNYHFIMKNLSLIFLLTFFFSQFAVAQEELEAELEERFFELIEQLEERKFSLQELQAELEEVKSEGDDFGQTLLETEVEGITDWIRQNTDSLEGLRDVIDSKDLDPEQKESAFASGIERHHRRNGLLELEFESHRLEVELQLHEDEGEEEIADRLEERLDRLNERIEKTKEIHAKWEQVEVARKAGEHDKAEELGHALWLEERELDLKVKLGEMKLEVAEKQWHADELERESERVKKTLALSSEMRKQTALWLGEWEKFKERLNKSQGDERNELIEEYHRSEEKFHLRNEILNVRRQLVFAESEGDEEEVEELNEFIEELKLEIQEFDDPIDP